jgi:hypothetical protein
MADDRPQVLADCEAECHQSHDPVYKRWHDPGWSCGEVQRAITEAVSAEKERAEAAEAKLAAVAARLVVIRHALEFTEGHGEARIDCREALQALDEVWPF